MKRTLFTIACTLTAIAFTQAEIPIDNNQPPTPSSTKSRFRTDQMRLTQIALNLGENALKFSAGQESPVRIAVDKSGDRLRLIVEDHGPGIPPDMTKAVFEEFSQAGTEVSPLDEGVGLGLAVVRINADLLGGTVRVQALEPQGTRFLVEIPEMGGAAIPNEL